MSIVWRKKSTRSHWNDPIYIQNLDCRDSKHLSLWQGSREEPEMLARRLRLPCHWSWQGSHSNATGWGVAHEPDQSIYPLSLTHDVCLGCCICRVIWEEGFYQSHLIIRHHCAGLMQRWVNAWIHQIGGWRAEEKVVDQGNWVVRRRDSTWSRPKILSWYLLQFEANRIDDARKQRKNRIDLLASISPLRTNQKDGWSYLTRFPWELLNHTIWTPLSCLCPEDAGDSQNISTQRSSILPSPQRNPKLAASTK